MNTGEPQALEMVAAEILKRISKEPAYSVVLYKMLVYCETARSLDEIDRQVRSFPEMKTALQSPQVLLLWLVQAGGIEELPQEKQASKWQTTAAGESVVQAESPRHRIEHLLTADPAYSSVYREVLQACLAPKSRDEVESLLRGNPLLETPKIYPSFFLETLERAGGLEWDRKWQTTRAGKDFLN
jgi:hypothetical protein